MFIEVKNRSFLAFQSTDTDENAKNRQNVNYAATPGSEKWSKTDHFCDLTYPYKIDVFFVASGAVSEVMVLDLNVHAFGVKNGNITYVLRSRKPIFRSERCE